MLPVTNTIHIKINDHIDHEEYAEALAELEKLPDSLQKKSTVDRLKVDQKCLESTGQKLFEQIASGRSMIGICHQNTREGEIFKRIVLNTIGTLLTKSLGQKLIQKILLSNIPVIIYPYLKFRTTPSDLFSKLKKSFLLGFDPDFSKKKFLQDRTSRLFLRLPPCIGLVHELCHVNDGIDGTMQLNFSYDPKHTMEEMYAITGKVNYKGHSYLPYNIYNENAFRQLFRIPDRTSYE
ncbi:MAG TPA: hypothetical protein VLF61_02965 [Rhabdochlamydiaceae bacterium]|nr:hypothetical protein [Rhabdochlamydiaceae bacterium]